MVTAISPERQLGSNEITAVASVTDVYVSNDLQVRPARDQLPGWRLVCRRAGSTRLGLLTALWPVPKPACNLVAHHR